MNFMNCLSSLMFCVIVILLAAFTQPVEAQCFQANNVCQQSFHTSPNFVPWDVDCGLQAGAQMIACRAAGGKVIPCLFRTGLGYVGCTLGQAQAQRSAVRYRTAYRQQLYRPRALFARCN